MKSKKTKYVFLAAVLILLAGLPAVSANHASLATEKQCYNVGSAVKFTMSNNGQNAITLTDGHPWDARNAQGNIVYSPFRDNTLVDLDAGDTLSWSWNQKGANGLQVAAGKYSMVVPTPMFNPNDGANLESALTIALDADEDCIADAADECPYDNTNDCIRSKDVQRPIGGRDDDKLFDCIDIKWCPDNDGDGASNDKDGCPELKGPAWNNYCPDYKYKQAAVDDAQATNQAMLGTTLVAVLANLIPGVGQAIFIGVAVGEVVMDVVIATDATLQVINDPPDSNYKELAQLEYRPVVLLPEINEINFVTNKLITASINYNAAANAFVHSNERYMGAELARDFEWMQEQASMTRFYALKTADAIKGLNTALTEYELMLAKYGANIMFTKSDVLKFQGRVRAEGASALPPYELEFARNNLFATENEIQSLQTDILAVDAATWNDEPLSGKIEALKKANNNYIIALENYAGEVGANILFVPAETKEPQGNSYGLRISNSPEPFKSGFVLLHLKQVGRQFDLWSKAEVVAGDLPASVYGLNVGPEWVFIYINNAAELPRGTSGIMARINLPPETQAKLEVVRLGGDFKGWPVGQRQKTIVAQDEVKILTVSAVPPTTPTIAPATQPAES